jgi:Na+/melibiose symporter-like transporter
VSEQARPDERHDWLFWSSAAVGWAIVAFGVWTLLRRAGATKPLNFTVLFIGIAVAHDVLFDPAVSLVGRLGSDLSARIRTVVFVAAVVSGSLVLVALPPLIGEAGDNASLLPRDYSAGLLVSLVVVWGAAAITVAVRRLARERS